MNDVNRIEMLQEAMEAGRDEHRHRVEVRMIRRVKAPNMGPSAYTTTSLYGSWGFGKGAMYRSSKHAITQLTQQFQPYLDLCSACELIVWNGCSGSPTYIKSTDELFDTYWNGGQCLIGRDDIYGQMD